jgi:ribose transport system ATP-binding protein
MLTMRDIRKSFGATVALDGVTLSVDGGEIVALVGENGAGKSTLMRVLSGAVLPDAGSMTLGGRPYQPHDPHAARMAGVAMVYQELSVVPHLTGAENIVLGVEPVLRGCVRRDAMSAIAHEALEQVGASRELADRQVRTMSLAERQLVEIARSVALKSRVLVFDEPTSALTAEDTRRLFDLLRRLRSGGHAVVFISHFLEEVREIADRFVVLRDGASVGGGRTSDHSMSEIASMMVGRDVSDLFPRSRRTPGEVILDIAALAGARKPASASFVLRRGEVLGLAGLIGAGRSELLRALFGLDPLRSGRIRFAHYSGAARPSERWRQGMGMVSEDRAQEGLALSMTIADNMTLSRLDAFGRWGLLSPARQVRAASEWIRTLGIKSRDPRQRIGELSGGNQQKVALARLLHHQVDLLLLDEPTRGIDVASKTEIYQLIDRLAAQGKAVLIVSSYLPELLGICDRVAVMVRGELRAPRPVSELTEHDIMHQATGAA